MNIDKLVRFGFASKRRKIMFVVLAVIGGVGILMGNNDNDSPVTAQPSQVETTTSTGLMGDYLKNHPLTSPTTSPSPDETVTKTTIKTIVSYSNCKEVKANGAAPIHKGEPGYSTKLDRDGDGVACDQ